MIQDYGLIDNDFEILQNCAFKKTQHNNQKEQKIAVIHIKVNDITQN